MLLIAFPMMSFLILLMFSSWMSRTLTSIVGVIGLVLSFCYSVYFLFMPAVQDGMYIKMWTFLPEDIVAASSIDFAIYLDTLSLTMTLVITFVSSLIALYSSEYMAHEAGLARFFAVINLFVAFMLTLVLADNLWLLFLGWEGVGLCSYLLIGFYFREANAVRAAMKAFITTRIGDVFLLFGLFLCLYLFGTLDMQIINVDAAAMYPQGNFLITVALFCFIGGAVGKSAQLPLQTWLADAMWGPTPVSALIHAATMVTAGVYLIARMHGLFLLSDEAQTAVMIVGVATLIYAGLAAIAQSDMKRVLAYSTMSQIGFMFLALGVGAWQAAIFHLATHAFFKALLFLSVGVIGHSLHTYDLHKMGGLREKFPTLFILFLIGCASLMGLPIISAGYFSKEWILGAAAHAPRGSMTIYSLAVVGTLLTGIYTTRMIMLAFFGKARTHHDVHGSGMRMYAPLMVLALFSTILGFLETPSSIFGIHVIADFLRTSLPELPEMHESMLLLLLPSVAVLFGIIFAFVFFRGSSSRENWLRSFARSGFAIDLLYDKLFVRPYASLARAMKSDVVLMVIDTTVVWINYLFLSVSRRDSGRLTHYISFVIVGALALASVMVF